ncbi:uncharacterized protein TNCV_1146401 [Trichonephila clavipes]|nr:uncharacterized protein TNCV_1146401 [Trichonephila clavipes]
MPRNPDRIKWSKPNVAEIIDVKEEHYRSRERSIALGNIEKVQKSYYFPGSLVPGKETLGCSEVTAEIRDRFQQLQNLAQKYAFLRPEVILSMDELNLDQAPQDITKEEFQLECVRLQAFAAATDPGSTRRLLATDHVILNHGQVTWTTPELAPPLLTTTPHQREDVSALDRFNVHRCPTRRVFSGTGLELVTRPATIRYLYHSATAAIPI